MKTIQRNNRKKKPYGPNIVRAWFDTAFHYALQGLADERGFLARGNWTYRFGKRRLEYIGTLAEHLPEGARENLEQFLSFFPAVGALIEQHDRDAGRLFESCAAYHAAIIQNPRFLEGFENVAAEAPSVLGVEFSSHFGAYSAKEDFAGLLAEYLVNNIGDLPDYYSTSRLWNHYRERLVQAIRTPELTPYQHQTEAAGKRLLHSVDELTTALKTIRSALSLEFDVPYVAEIPSAR